MLIDTFKELVPQISQWSRANFGNQTSKVTGQDLESIAPLLGIMEEFGELVESTSSDADKDAVADILVYLADFCARDGVDVSRLTIHHFRKEDLARKSCRNLCSSSKITGKLCHAVLKRHQGIRGFDNTDYYVSIRDEEIGRILGFLVNTFSDVFCENALRAVWDKVKNRNWKADPVTAGGHA